MTVSGSLSYSTRFLPCGKEQVIYAETDGGICHIKVSGEGLSGGWGKWREADVPSEDAFTYLFEPLSLLNWENCNHAAGNVIDGNPWSFTFSCGERDIDCSGWSSYPSRYRDVVAGIFSVVCSLMDGEAPFDGDAKELGKWRKTCSHTTDAFMTDGRTRRQRMSVRVVDVRLNSRPARLVRKLKRLR